MKSIKKHKRRNNDNYKPLKRLARYRKPINVVPIRFVRGKIMGDFGAMLKDDKIRQFSVCMFNDNTHQWEFAGLNPTTPQHAGGGNSIARPYEYTGDSIGIPTGPYSSLDEIHMVCFPTDPWAQPHTVKEIISEAFNRTVRLFLDKPEKDTLYFSVNPMDSSGSIRIGLAIFSGAVGEDVIQEISNKIQEIPAAVKNARRSGVRP